MTDPSDNLDMQVLSEINSRTLVNGAAIEPNLISEALSISPASLREILTRLQQKGLVTLESDWRVSLSPAGHEHLAI